MNEKQLLDYYKKFPVFLKEKILDGTIIFPANIEYEYEPVMAYRGITRKAEDNSSVNKYDMKSYYEEGKKPRGVKKSENEPGLYAVSLYDNLNMFKQSFKFPRPNKKIAKGYIFQEGGPKANDGVAHINWWLFENVDFSGFIIMENVDE